MHAGTIGSQLGCTVHHRSLDADGNCVYCITEIQHGVIIPEIPLDDKQ
jgi:hypothetical protein